jgi:hypothetical protein
MGGLQEDAQPGRWMLKGTFLCFSSEGERHPQAVEEHRAASEEGHADRVSPRRLQVGPST